MKILLQDWPLTLKLSLSFRASSMAALLLISSCATLHKLQPFHDPDRLVSVVKDSPTGEEPISDTDILAFRKEIQTLEPIAAYRFWGYNLTDRSAQERISSAQVSENFFRALGVQPVLGRAFTSEECLPSGKHVVVISHDLWQYKFSSDPSLLGMTITLDQQKHTVIGVMPPGFRFPNDRDVWAPLVFENESLGLGGNSKKLEVIARLKPSVTIQQAQADMNAVAHKLERDYPATNSSRVVKVIPLLERLDQKEKEFKESKLIILRPVNPKVETGKEK